MATYTITYTSAGLVVNDKTFRDPVMTIVPKTIINEPVLEIHSDNVALGIVLTDTVTVAGSPGANTLTGLKAQIQAIIPSLASLATQIANAGGGSVSAASLVAAQGMTIANGTLVRVTTSPEAYYLKTDTGLQQLSFSE